MKIIPNEYVLGMDHICWSCGFPIANNKGKIAKCCRNKDSTLSECQRANAIYRDRQRKHKHKKKKEPQQKSETVMRKCLGSSCNGSLFPSKSPFNRVCDKCSRLLGGRIPKKTMIPVNQNEINQEQEK